MAFGSIAGSMIGKIRRRRTRIEAEAVDGYAGMTKRNSASRNTANRRDGMISPQIARVALPCSASSSMSMRF
jgi:hypothetical protein